MKATDPVCGMEIDSVAGGLMQKHEGRQYHFCSTQCKDAFVADPGKYAVAGAKGEPGSSGSGHHGKHSGSGGHGCCH
ncbi:MAG: YHS domain-containing protein [Betaproteobacteria bacterium]|nr:YHS domain-containing protein [Betaproteobacteria bacterium]